MLAKRISELWCEIMHDSPMWPIHGRYECRTCGHVYRVPWREADEKPRQAGIPAWTQALGHM